jgi:hypothetical protein
LKKEKKFGEWFKESFWMFIVGAVVSILWIYFMMPTAIMAVVIPLFFFMVLMVNLGRLLKDTNNMEASVGTAVIVSLLLLIVSGVVGGERYNAMEVAKIPSITIALDNASTDEIPLNNARLVPKQSADLWKAPTAIGTLGYKNRVGDAFAVVENGTLMWRVPMEYGDDWKAWIYRDEGTDGYVEVSAELAHAAPNRVPGFSMKYIPSAIFGYNLHRVIYFQYPELYQGKHVFQLDDKKRPIFITMLQKPTIGRTGEIPVGFIISNPEIKELKFYDLDNVPDYVQRITDELLLERYIAWWGEYQKGYWNYQFAQEGVIEPSGEVSPSKSTSGEIIINRGDPDVYYLLGKDGKPYFYTAMVTPGTSLSITGYVMADVRNLRNIVFYKTEGYLSDIAAAQNIQQDPQVSTVMGYHVNQPIRYEYRGIPTYIAVVLGSNQEVKMFGIVDGLKGTTLVGEDFNEVLARYEQSISGKPVNSKDLCQVAEKILTRLNVSLEYSNNETQLISVPVVNK